VNCNRSTGLSEQRHHFSWEELTLDEELRSTEPTRGRLNPVHLARQWQATMEEPGESRAELARRLRVSRARVTQIWSILDLDPEALGLVEQQTGPGMVSERALRALRHLDAQAQRDCVGNAPSSRQLIL
jgi:hypothetical protein